MQHPSVISREIPLVVRAESQAALECEVLRYEEWQRFHAAEENGAIKWERWKRGSVYLFGSAPLKYSPETQVHAKALKIEGINLKWEIDENSVRVRVDAWPDNELAKLAQQAITRGEVKGLSIEFHPLEVSKGEKGHTVEKAVIEAVALVRKPAYDYALVRDEPQPKQITRLI